MNADDLLAKLEKQELIAPDVIASLRRQVAAAPEPIAPAAIAKLLVEKKHLTAGQAQRLLEHSGASQIAKQPATASTIQKSPQPTASKPVAAHNSSVHDDLGLAPLEELESLAAAPSAVAKSAITKAAAKSAVKPAAAAPVAKLDDLGLAPLEDLAPATAPVAPAKSTIQKAAPPTPAPQKSTIQKGPAKPATVPAAAKPAAAKPADLPALDDLGGLTALDELPSLAGLDPLGTDPLGDPLGGDLADLSSPLGGTADLGALATQTAAPARAQISPATVAAVQAAQESRTTMFVGIAIGGVALLVVVIGLAVFLWPRGDGSKEFQAAEQLFQEKQYPAAIEQYDALLRSHPRHDQASLIRVHRGLSAIHAASGSSPDWPRLLPVLIEHAPPLAAEPAIAQAHVELVPLLVQTTEALADAATNAKFDEQSPSRLQQARTALTLCNDSRLLPSNLRPWQKLANIEDRLQLLARELQRTAARDQAKSAITQAFASSNLAGALQARANLLRTYPELAGDELWTELAPEFTVAAVKSVKTSADKKPAEREAAKTPVLAALPWQLLNARLHPSPPPASERVVLVTAAGAVHALDASDGHVCWSRYLASACDERPLLSTDSRFAWLVDHQQKELLSVNALTGKLLWCQPLGEQPVGSPLLVDGKIHLTTAQGKLQSFDAASGELQASATLAQLATVGPVATEDGKQLLQLADEGLLYVFDAADLKCAAVHYLGHTRNAAQFLPIMFQRQWVTAVQRGNDTELCVVATDATPSTIKRQRIEGTAGAPLVVAGKRLLLATTQGKLQVLEPSEGNEPLQLVQTIPATGSPLVRTIFATPDGIVTADRGLTQLKVDAAGKLQPGWSAFTLDLCESGGQLHDQSLVISRYVADQDAIFAASVSTADGLANWQTPLPTPITLLAGEEGAQPVAVSATAVAKLLTLDGMTSDLGVEFKQLVSQPAYLNLKALPLGIMIAVGDEQLLTPALGARELLWIKPLDFSVRKWKLPGTLAGQPVQCGQNLLVPLSDGSIHSFNSETGVATAAPFLLPSLAGPSPGNLSVTALDAAGQEVLVSNGLAIVKIGLISEPQTHWVEQAAVLLSDPLVAPPIALAEVVLAADSRGRLHIFSLPDLRAGEPIDLKGGRITWGPHQAGDCLLLATDRDELWCCDATRQPRWVQSLATQPVGLPRIRENTLIIASGSGRVEARSAASGDVSGSVELAQPLAGSILVSGNTLWLSTTFGQVLQVAIPAETAQP